MKKIETILLSFILFISCEGPIGPQGPMGPEGPAGDSGNNGGSNWYSKSFTIPTSEWLLSGKPGDLNTYFYADRDIPELSEKIFNKGSIIGYIETGNNVKNGIPFVLHMGEEDGEIKGTIHNFV